MDSGGSDSQSGSHGGPNDNPRKVSKSPSIMNMGFLKGLGSSEKKTRGEPAKRRGPKPDSKPAQTRRQELNRQAQRTHRERKEQYIRTLETDISRLREGYSNDISAVQASLQQQREALQAQEEENNMLKEILTSNGIPYEAELARRKAARSADNPDPSHAGSTSGTQSVGPQSNSTLFATPDTTVSSTTSPGATGMMDVDPKQHGGTHSRGGFHAGQNEQPGVSENSGHMGQVSATTAVDIPGIFERDPQLGIEFVLALENPCRDHIEILCRSASMDGIENKNRIYSGHALMACSPPPSHLSSTPIEVQYPHQTYDIPHANLGTLLNLSRQLVVDGQITPIMALQSIKNHDMYPSLTRADVLRMMEDLVAKVRCYGFGAVVEDFEFMDSLSSVLGSKFESLLAAHEHPGTHDGGDNITGLSTRTTNVLTYS